MKWLHSYRNGRFISKLYEVACTEAVKTREYGRFALRMRARWARR